MWQNTYFPPPYGPQPTTQPSMKDFIEFSKFLERKELTKERKKEKADKKKKEEEDKKKPKKWYAKSYSLAQLTFFFMAMGPILGLTLGTAYLAIIKVLLKAFQSAL